MRAGTGGQWRLGLGAREGEEMSGGVGRLGGLGVSSRVRVSSDMWGLHIIAGTRVCGFGYGTSIPAPARPDGYEILPITIPMGIFLYHTLPIYSEYPSGYRVSGTHCHP
jgi:hypothetical protein